MWVQPVSSMPATRLEVVALQEELDRRLQQRQARETGICPVRRELYTQCFGQSHNPSLSNKPVLSQRGTPDRYDVSIHPRHLSVLLQSYFTCVDDDIQTTAAVFYLT